MSFVQMLTSMPWFHFTPLALINQHAGVFGVNLGYLWDDSECLGDWRARLSDLFERCARKTSIRCAYSRSGLT
jgi:hypothetical protein